MFRKILILLALFIASYLGAHYYIRWKNTIHDDVTKLGRLVDCEPNEFRSLMLVQNEGGSVEELRFDRMDHPEPGVPAVTAVARWRWSFSRPLGGEADPVLIRRLASTICELYDPIPVREREFKQTAKTYRQAQRVEAVFSNQGSERHVVFDFGDAEERSNVIHFTAPGVSRWVKIPDRFQQVASLPPKEYRNMRVMRLDADNIQRAILTIDGKERFSLIRSGADWKVYLKDQERGDGSEEAEKFINRLTTLRAIDIENASFSAEGCEREPSRAILNVRAVAGMEEVVRFAYGKSGQISACSSLGTQKFGVHRDLLKYLDIPIGTVLAKRR